VISNLAFPPLRILTAAIGAGCTCQATGAVIIAARLDTEKFKQDIILDEYGRQVDNQ
jgi:hypothetical protein